MNEAPEPDKTKNSLTRRSFAIGAAVAATAALIPAVDVKAQSEPAKATAASQQPAESAKLTPAAQAEVEMKVNSIFRKYGSRLSDEQKADIRKVMTENQGGLEKMRAFVLENGDQPATVFRSMREREAK